MSEEKKIRVFNQITARDLQGKGAKTLAIRPNEPSNYGDGSLSGRQLQIRFDSIADLVKTRYNEMAEGLSSADALEYFYLPKIDGDQITLGTGEAAKVDLSSFIKKISNTTGDLVVETPYENSAVTTIKSILAKIYTDLQEIYDDYATKVALQQHSSDKDADGKDVTDTHPSIRRLIPDKIDEHNISTDSHSDIRGKIGEDIEKHNTSTDSHSDIRNKIDTDIALHSSDKDADGKVVTTAHPDIRDQIGKDIDAHNTSDEAHEDIRELIDGIIGEDGTLTQLEKVVDDFLTGAADNDTTLDTLKEIVAYIELNRETIDRIIGVNGAAGLLDDKIDKTSIVTNLTTNDSSKVLAASMGEVITEAIKQAVTDKVTNNSLSTTLSEYLKKSELGDIIRPEDLKNYIDVNELAEALKPYAKTNDIVIPDVSKFIDTDALNKALKDYAKTGDIPDVSKFIDTDELNNVLKGYVKSGDINLDNYLTIGDLQGYAKENDDDGYAVVRTNDLADYAKTTTTDGAVVRTNDLSSTLANYALSSDLEGYAPLVDEYARNVAYDNPEDPFITTAVLDSRLENIEVGGGGGDIAVDGITLDANEEDLIEAQAVRCVDNGDVEFAEDRKYLKFFVGTKDEYDSLNDKSGVLAIIKEQGMPTSAEVKSAVDYYGNIRNGFTAVPRAVADEDGNAFESSYLKKADAANTYATKSSLSAYATTESLNDYAKQTAVDNIVNGTQPVSKAESLNASFSQYTNTDGNLYIELEVSKAYAIMVRREDHPITFETMFLFVGDNPYVYYISSNSHKDYYCNYFPNGGGSSAKLEIRRETKTYISNDDGTITVHNTYDYYKGSEVYIREL